MKKLSPCLFLIISLSLTLTSSLPILGGFQLVDTAVAQVDNQIQGLINAGLEKITQAGGLSDNYYLSAINQIAQQTQDDVTNYRFNCNFQNSQGQTITALFNASYEYSTATQTVQNYEYNVFTYSLSETVSNTFVQITSESIQSSSFIQSIVSFGSRQIIQSIVSFGSRQIIQRALSAGKISSENFQISNINSVSSQVVDSAVFYNCSVDLEDSQGSTLTALYTVYYQALLNITYIIDFSYQVSSSQEQVTDLVQIVAPVQSQYTSISVSTVQNSETIQSALNFGAQQVVQIGNSDNNLSSTQFSISEIVRAYSQIIANGIFYKFNCLIQVQSSQQISATFEVYYQTSTGQTNLTSYDYQVSSTSTTSTNLTYVTPVININGNFTKCTETQIRNEQDIQSALSFGANQVAIIGIQQGDVPSTSFSLFQITSVYQQTTVVGVSYQYEVLLSNKNGVILAANFTVLAQSSSVFVLSSYNYQVYLNSLGTSVTTVNTNTTTSTTVSTSITVNVTITTSVTIGVINYPTNSTSSSNTVKSPGSGWVLLTEQEIKNSVVQSCIRYGMNDILQIGIQLKSFPYSIWRLTEVIAVYQKNQNWGQFYQITLHLTSASGLRVDTTFTLSYNIATLLIRLNSYYYNVGAFISGKTVASTSGFNNTTPAPTNTSNLPFSQSNDGLEYASNGYYRIPIHWVDESAEIKNCINFGAPAVVQVGINQKKIPVSNYIIYKVVWVQRYISSRGNYYAIRIYLTNIDNVDLVATFTTFINKSNNNISLYTYAYTVDNVRTTWYTPGGTTNSTGSTSATTVTNVTSLVTTASWTALPALQIDNNPQVQAAIKYATSILVQISIQSNSAPSAVYNISTINGVSQKTTQDGVFYSCDVVLTSSTNVQIITNFTVYYERSSESYNLTTYQYQVNSAQNTVGQEIGLSNSGYIQVNISEVTSNSQISSCLNYGIRQIIQSYQSYSVSEINSCYSQVINSAYYYMFDVNLTSESNSNTIIQLNYIVYFRADINQQVVTAYSINTINVTSSSSSSSSASSSSSSSSEITYTEESDTSDSDYETLVNVGSNKCIDELYSKNVIVSTDFSVSHIRKVFTSSSSSSLYYQFEVTLRNTAGINLDVTLNMRRSQSISLSESVLVSYFVQGTSSDQSSALVSDYSESETSQSQTSSCQKISNTQIQSGTRVKEAIDYGVQEIISKVTQNSQISSDFVIDQTESVYQEIASSSSYKAKLVLRNSQGRRVKCHYSVKYSSSTSIKQVTSYNYIIY